MGGYPDFFPGIGIEGFFTAISTSIENDVSVEEDTRGKIEFVNCAALGWSICEFGCSSFGVEAGEAIAIVIDNAVIIEAEGDGGDAIFFLPKDLAGVCFDSIELAGFAVPIELSGNARLVRLSFDCKLLIQAVGIRIDQGVECAVADDDFLGAFGLRVFPYDLASGCVETGDGSRNTKSHVNFVSNGNEAAGELGGA